MNFPLNPFPDWTVGGGLRALISTVRGPSNRREDLRFGVPLNLSLRCFPVEAASFDAAIVDISRGGMGVMICGVSVNLMRGILLKKCTFVFPGSETIVVDLEVCNTSTIVQPDGPAQRAGVKFRGESKNIDALRKMFGIALRASRDSR